MGTANIVFGKAGVSGSPGMDPGSTLFYANGSGEALTTNASTSAATTAAAGTDGNKFANAVRIIASVDGYFAIGASPTATKTDGRLLKANTEYYFACLPGDKVAVIDA